MILTLNQLEEISPYTGVRRLELILPNLNYTLQKYDINNDLRIAHFLTQVIAESNYFRYVQELGSGQDYEGNESLGNTQRGDGRRYIGRGYIKIIGRFAYTEYARFSKIEADTYPQYVTTPKVAMDISGWVWHIKKLNVLADQNNLDDITRAIKGEAVAMREREDIFNRVSKQLSYND